MTRKITKSARTPSNYDEKDLISASYICDVRPLGMAHNAKEIVPAQFYRVRGVLQNNYGNRYLGSGLNMPHDKERLPCLWLVAGGIVEVGEVGNRDTYRLSPQIDKGSVTLIHSSKRRVQKLAELLGLPDPNEHQYEAVRRY